MVLHTPSTKMWLWILISFNMVSELQGYADGNFPESCGSMLPEHGASVPQKSEPPYMITLQDDGPENPVTVTLKSNGTKPFIGFMLQARNASDGLTGNFIALDNEHINLLTCDDSPDSAVTQNHNREKTSISVNWTAQGASGPFTFRATVLEKYTVFWEHVELVFIPAVHPNPNPKTDHEIHGLMVMCLENFVEGVTWTMAQCFTGSKFHLNKVLMIFCNVACAVLAMVSLVFFLLAKSFTVALVALVVVLIVIIIIELVLLLLPLGPSHELKGICGFAHQVCSIIHRVLTIAVILVGTVNCICLCEKNKTPYWLLIVLIAYTVWIRLNEIWVSELNVQKRKLQKNKKESSENDQCEPQSIKERLCAVRLDVLVAVIFMIGNLLFTAALIPGLFQCKQPTV